MFHALKQFVGVEELKDGYEVETALTLWLKTSDTVCYRQGIGNFVPRDIRTSAAARTVCRSACT